MSAMFWLGAEGDGRMKPLPVSRERTEKLLDAQMAALVARHGPEHAARLVAVDTERTNKFIRVFVSKGLLPAEMPAEVSITP